MPGTKKYSFLALLTVTVCILAIYIHKHREGQTGRIDSLMITLTGALQKHFSYVGRGTQAITEHYLWLVNTKKQNEDLQEELDRLRSRVTLLQEVELENRRLRETLQFRQRLDHPTLQAHIVSRDASSDYFGLRIDKGSDDGVKEGMGVISSAGVVGRILSVTPRYSMVQTLIDPASNIDVVVQRSRARGILSGQSKQLQCKIKYLDKLEDVLVNDAVVSTDFGGVFPKGLIVGHVTAAIPSAAGILQTVIVKSAVDIFRLEEVSIVFPRVGSEKTPHKS